MSHRPIPRADAYLVIPDPPSGRGGAAYPTAILRTSQALTIDEAVALRDAVARLWPDTPPYLRVEVCQAADLARARRRASSPLARIEWWLMNRFGKER